MRRISYAETGGAFASRRVGGALLRVVKPLLLRLTHSPSHALQRASPLSEGAKTPAGTFFYYTTPSSSPQANTAGIA